jgi:hypothetical protein
MHETDDVVGFIRELVRAKELHGAAAGVAARVVQDGSMKGLTEKQHGALVIGVKEWLSNYFRGYNPPFVPYGEWLPTPQCTENGDEVPWCEVFVAGALYHGACSWCVQVHHKGDD